MLAYQRLCVKLPPPLTPVDAAIFRSRNDRRCHVSLHGWRAADFGDDDPIPACAARDQAGCLVAYASARKGDFGRAQRLTGRSLYWTANGRLRPMIGEPVCVNPLLGSASIEDAPARLNRGAVNATGLEWGARPGFLVRQVSAQCVNGLLRFTQPRSNSLRPDGDWAERQKAAGYNLFYADLEADALARLAAWSAVNPPR